MGSLFISYRQEDDAQKDAVRAFADALKGKLSPHGWNVVLDQYQPPGGPDDQWPLWSANQVRDSARVLMIVTDCYVQCMLKKLAPSGGRGAAWEASAIYNDLYACGGASPKYRGVHIGGDPRATLPAEIAGMHCFAATRDLDEIAAWILGIAPAPVSPPVPLAWPAPRAGFAHALADREAEFRFFCEMLAGKTLRRILLLEALTNHGKSALVREFESYARGHLAFALADLKGCADSAQLHAMLRSELLAAGLATCRGTDTLRALLDAVEEAAHSRPVLLLLDTFEQANGEIQRFLDGHLLAAVRRAPGLCIVVAGQKVPDHAKAAWGNLAQPFTLASLEDAQHWIDWAARHFPHLRRDYVAGLAVSLKGNPGSVSALLTTLAASLPPGARSV